MLQYYHLHNKLPWIPRTASNRGISFQFHGMDKFSGTMYERLEEWLQTCNMSSVSASYMTVGRVGSIGHTLKSLNELRMVKV